MCDLRGLQQFFAQMIYVTGRPRGEITNYGPLLCDEKKSSDNSTVIGIKVSWGDRIERPIYKYEFESELNKQKTQLQFVGNCIFFPNCTKADLQKIDTLSYLMD